MKTLILYYSQARGNTKQIAQMIQERLHAEMEQIQTRVPYTGSYDAIVNQGKREVDSGYTPEIVPVSADLSAYLRLRSDRYAYLVVYHGAGCSHVFPEL